MLILGERDVLGLLDRREAILCAAEAYRRHAQGQAVSSRAALWRAEPKSGALLLAGAEGSRLSLKSNVHAYPDDPAAARRWGSLVTLWDFAACRPLALLSAQAFNEHRTAAGLAAAAFLAPPAARTLAVFGAGKSAPEAIRYLRIALPGLERLLLVGRSPERLAALAAAARAWPELDGMAIETNRSAAQAAAEADVIVTVTTSPTPVFPGDVVRAGALVILAGANRPEAREADDALMARAAVVVDGREGALEKAGDILLARRSGALSDARILGEIGALGGARPQFPAGADLFVFKSTGLPLQDLVLATRLHERARETGVGREIDLDDGTSLP